MPQLDFLIFFNQIITVFVSLYFFLAVLFNFLFPIFVYITILLLILFLLLNLLYAVYLISFFSLRLFKLNFKLFFVNSFNVVFLFSFVNFV